jgi:hypothetical protein
MGGNSFDELQYNISPYKNRIRLDDNILYAFIWCGRFHFFDM